MTVDFDKNMVCPSCDNPLYKRVEISPETSTHFAVMSSIHTPDFCTGRKSWRKSLSCKRSYPHLHWECGICGCCFVSNTKTFQTTMREVLA